MDAFRQIRFPLEKAFYYYAQMVKNNISMTTYQSKCEDPSELYKPVQGFPFHKRDTEKQVIFDVPETEWLPMNTPLQNNCYGQFYVWFILSMKVLGGIWTS